MSGREDKERRGEGFARRGRRAVVVSPREEKDRGRGIWYGVGSRADRELEKRGNTQYTRMVSVARCGGHAITGC